MTLEGTTLFPATASRGEWTGIGCQRAVTQTLFDLMGPEYRYGGLVRLRHTFVIRQLLGALPWKRLPYGSGYAISSAWSAIGW